MKIGSTFNHESYGPLKITGKRYSRMGNKTLWIGEDENGEQHELDGSEKPAKPEKVSPKFIEEAAKMFGMTQGPKGEDADEDYIIEAVIPRVLEQIRQPEDGKDGADADVELIIREMLPLVMENMPKPEKINEASIVSKVLSRIRIPQDGKDGAKGNDGSPDTPVEVKAKLESLEGDDRLDAKAIKNLPRTFNSPSVGGVSRLQDLSDVTLSSPTNNQALTYDSATGKWVNETVSGGSGTPGGSDTQVQFNDGGSFGGDAGLTYNKTTNTLSPGNIVMPTDGRISLNTDLPTNTAVGLIQLKFNDNEAKAILAYVDENDDEVVWLQAHNYLEFPGNQHKHFSIEASDAAGLKQTRFSVSYGADINVVNVNAADFYVAGTGGIRTIDSDFDGILKLTPVTTFDVYPQGGSTYGTRTTLANTDQVTLSAIGSGFLYFNDAIVINTASGVDYAGLLRVCGESATTFQGGYIQYDGAGNEFIIGTHSAADSATGSDVEVIRIPRAGTSVTLNVPITPVSNDLAAIGSSSLSWSDLFLASGAVINFAASDFTLTHSTGVLTASGSLTAATFRSTSGGFVNNSSSNNARYHPASTGSTIDRNIADASPCLIVQQINASSTGDILQVKNNASTVLTIAQTGAATFTSTLSIGTSNALTAGTIELGHASDTTLSRSAAGTLAVEGVDVLTTSNTKTLTNKSIGAGTLTLEENASIALDPAGSADGKYSGITVTGTAGATLAFGDLVYLDPTDSRWELVDANAAAAADGDARGMIGMCVLAAASDGSATTILLQGIIRADAAFPALTIGAPVYASETAGDITSTQPTTTDVVIRVLGSALTADEFYFNPSPDFTTHT